MSNNPNKPQEFDAVLGGKAPPPVEGIVLGGLEGVKHRLTNPVVEARVAALSEALNYGEAGLDLVIGALKDELRQVHCSAYRLLRQRVEPQVKIALQEYKPWNLMERLRINGYPEHITTFANRRVEEFDPITGITDPVGIAYAVRISSRWNEQEYITDKLERLLQDPQASSLEALVIGAWDGNIVDKLIAASSQLKSLKAVFIGDITSDECEISWIRQSDISPVLAAYPKLEVLQVRGGEGLEFSPLQHNHLETLIVETGGLSCSTIQQICALNLPELEHLELWLGANVYGGNSSLEDLTPILFDVVFPNLTYLGLRNSEYSDDIADAIVRRRGAACRQTSPLMNSISVLDLSMGTLSDRGAEVLLNCPAVQQLDILNLSANFLSNGMKASLSLQQEGNIQVRILTDKPNNEYDYDCDEGYRYCSVSE